MANKLGLMNSKFCCCTLTNVYPCGANGRFPRSALYLANRVAACRRYSMSSRGLLTWMASNEQANRAKNTLGPGTARLDVVPFLFHHSLLPKLRGLNAIPTRNAHFCLDNFGNPGRSFAK